MPIQPVDPKLHTFRSPNFESVVQEAINFFIRTPVHPLPPASPFSAGGVYALYYIGSYSLYGRISSRNRKEYLQPIYVGKAVLPGWRTARAANDSEATSLYSRLREHARSVEQGQDLDTSDFKTRFMILDGLERDLVVPVEAELIRQFTPLWNTRIDGFGNHDPGKGRYEQARSEWDVLHPGRPWAERLKGDSPRLESIIAKIKRTRR